jgi:Ca2+-transporting ATPase
MVTGDYKETAAAIASKIGILRDGGRVLSGSEIDEIPDEEFASTVEEVDAFARVSPQHKVRILQALREQGHVAAMTGDGVNDAPALKRADIGVAMGITGTDVAKQTAEMVLTDDNFASIVSAVEEGRTIYSNIRKFVYYLISCNIGEILIIFLAMVFGWMIPLTPIMILWLNLVTDGAPALALGVEKGDPDIMKRPPRPPKEPVINKEMLSGLVVQAVVMTAAVLVSYLLALQRYPGDVQTARTIAFATLVCSELWRAFTSRSERHSVFRIGVFSNRWMLLAVASSLFFLLLIVYLPFLQNVFNIRPIQVGDWLRLLPFTFAAAIAAEITKIFLRRKERSYFQKRRQ